MISMTFLLVTSPPTPLSGEVWRYLLTRARLDVFGYRPLPNELSVMLDRRSA